MESAWGWNGFNILKPETWIPTFGLWCGPGWSGGQRTGTITPEMITEGPLKYSNTNRISPVDAICMEHDLAYDRAKGQPNEAQLILEADLALRRDIRDLDWDSLTPAETAYTILMDLAFTAKIAAVDAPSAAIEFLKQQSQDITDQGFAGGYDPVGVTYTDQFGASLSCVTDDKGNMQLDCSMPYNGDGAAQIQFNLEGQTNKISVLFGKGNDPQQYEYDHRILPGIDTWRSGSDVEGPGGAYPDLITTDNGDVYFMHDYNDVQNIEYELNELHRLGLLNNDYWNFFTQQTSQQLINNLPGEWHNGWPPPQQRADNIPGEWHNGWNIDPIGAFYDSQSRDFDQAPSIARHTPVVVDADTLQGLSAEQLASYDQDGDGRISLEESAGLRFWADLNEDGYSSRDAINNEGQSRPPIEFYDMFLSDLTLKARTNKSNIAQSSLHPM